MPGNGTGSIIATAVWNDYSFDGNDADGIVASTYVSQDTPCSPCKYVLREGSV